MTLAKSKMTFIPTSMAILSSVIVTVVGVFDPFFKFRQLSSQTPSLQVASDSYVITLGWPVFYISQNSWEDFSDFFVLEFLLNLSVHWLFWGIVCLILHRFWLKKQFSQTVYKLSKAFTVFLILISLAFGLLAWSNTKVHFSTTPDANAQLPGERVSRYFSRIKILGVSVDRHEIASKLTQIDTYQRSVDAARSDYGLKTEND